jgi:hypothetical protein
MPVPSIAVDEPLFRNGNGNNWSGASEGLTWQRLIRALENYGLHAELTRFGRIFIKAICTIGVFTQQFDPFHFGEVDEDNRKRDGYGPTLLAFVEYVARLYGVCIEGDTVLWSGLRDDGHTHSFTQQDNGHTYTLRHTADGVEGQAAILIMAAQASTLGAMWAVFEVVTLV